RSKRDWSSDVCSSDLITTMLAILLLREAESIDGGVPVVAGMGGFGLLSAAVAGGMGVAALVAPWAMARTDRILVVAAGSALSAEIGRASCRDRDDVMR